MLQNYLKIAFRNLVRNKVYSFINIVGLAVGMAVAMLIFLFVSHEVSFDKFHVNGDRIYMVMQKMMIGESFGTVNAQSSKLAPIMKENNAEIENYTRIYRYYSKKIVIKNPEEPTLTFFEKNVIFVESSFFQLFDFQLIEGSKTAALNNPYSMVINEKIAKKYFGNKNPIGKVLLYDGKHQFTITGICKNVPSNSTFQFDILTSLSTFPKLSKNDKMTWENSASFQTFLLLNSQNSVKKVASTILKCGLKTGAFFDNKSSYYLAQFSKEHAEGFGLASNDNQFKYVKIFSVVGISILFLAFFNYISLSTALSTKRAKEVGIRKVTGANRKSLIQQFYLESFLMCSISFGIGFLLVELFRQPFYDLLGLRIDGSFLFNPFYLYTLLFVFIVSIIFTGSYPAIILSSFSPIETIKGKFSNQLKGVTLRKTITVVQFAVSVTLIIVAFVMQRQLKYLQNKDLGMNIEQILYINFEEGGRKYVAFRDEVAKLTGVENISSSTDNIFNGWGEIKVLNKQTQKELFITSVNCDAQIFDLLNLKWDIPPKSTPSNICYGKVFLNESAIKALGIKGNPIEQFFTVSGSTANQEIGGVLKDFHYSGTLSKIKPMAYFLMKVDTSNISAGSFYVKLNLKANIQEKVAVIKNIYEKYDNEHPFDYHFLDEAFNSHFTNIEYMSNMFIIFMALTIIIACLGLFGLIAFMAEARKKEIGIRKILGASIINIAILLSKDFLKLVVLAFLIASPIAYYYINDWLKDFEYRIEISWWIFAFTGLMSITIALLTVIYQAIKAAIANPVKSLRTE